MAVTDKPKYSGHAATKFWERVAALPPEFRREVKSLGAALQFIETQTLNALAYAEDEVERAAEAAIAGSEAEGG